MISLLIFVLFFALVLTRTYRMSKASVNELSGIPLEDEVEMNQENKIDIL
jgi:type IV secretory pathway TrbL component